MKCIVPTRWRKGGRSKGEARRIVARFLVRECGAEFPRLPQSEVLAGEIERQANVDHAIGDVGDRIVWAAEYVAWRVRKGEYPYEFKQWNRNKYLRHGIEI